MERVNQDGSVAANKVVEKETILDENGEDVSAEEPIQTKLPSISYGLAADQLKEVFPELVYEDKDGNYSINYEEGEKDFMAQAAISSSEHRLQPGVQLRYVPEDPQPFTFTTDPRRVQQILINLITNACKHTSEGEIVVGSSLSEKPGYMAYSVTDTGPGIPREQAEVIFERFTKLNEFVQGTGLGLSICRDIASRMGAEVYLDTTYTGGSRFVFLVPVNPPKN